MTHAAVLFPELQVSSIRDPSTAEVTFPTEAVRTVRGVVRTSLDAPARTAAIARVMGEWGTGKTHLLLTARRALEEESERLGVGRPFVLAVSAVEADFMGWYRQEIARELGAGLVDEIITAVYGRAAADVARRSRLTAGAGDRLNEDPSLSRRYVKLNYLNASAVEAAFVELVTAGCGNAPDPVRHALRLVVGAQGELAQQWLAGRRLNERETALTGLPPSIEDERTVIGVLTSLAGLAAQAQRPFLLLVDEIEYLIRHDSRSGVTTNQTALKRLLAPLAGQGALVFVAGLPTAWNAAEPDLLERFTSGLVIELRALDSAQVRGLADLFSSHADAIDDTIAEAVVRSSGGNVRQVLALLRELALTTGTFARMPTPDEIAMASDRLAQRVDPDAAVASFVELLEASGLSVSFDHEVVPGIFADIVGARGGVPEVVVERKSATYQVKQHDQLQTFLERLRAVREIYPPALGIFLSDGAVDPRVQERISARAVDVFAFDVSRPDFPELVRPVVAEAAAPRAVETSDRDKSTRKLIGDVEEFKRSDEELYEELSERLAVRRADVELPAAAREEPRDEARWTYEEFVAGPTVSTRLRIIFGSPLALLAVVAAVLGFWLFFNADSLSVDLFDINSDEELASKDLILRAVAAVLFLGSAALLATRFSTLNGYYVLRARVLHNMLLRGAEARDLALMANNLDAVLISSGSQAARRAALGKMDSVAGA